MARCRARHPGSECVGGHRGPSVTAMQYCNSVSVCQWAIAERGQGSPDWLRQSGVPDHILTPGGVRASATRVG